MEGNNTTDSNTANPNPESATNTGSPINGEPNATTDPNQGQAENGGGVANPQTGQSGGTANAPSPVDQTTKEPTFEELIAQVENREESKIPIKRPVGRPAVIDIDVVRQLRQAFLMGCNDTEACNYANIHRQRLYEFEQKYPEFADYKQAWRDNPRIKTKATIYKELDDPTMARWYAETKMSDEFHKRQELTGGDGEAIPVKIEYIVPKPEGANNNATEPKPTNQPEQPSNPAPTTTGEPIASESIPAGDGVPTIEVPIGGDGVPQNPISPDPQTAPSVADPNGQPTQ